MHCSLLRRKNAKGHSGFFPAGKNTAGVRYVSNSNRKHHNVGVLVGSWCVKKSRKEWKSDDMKGSVTVVFLYSQLQLFSHE